jgi:hypothetical protein
LSESKYISIINVFSGLPKGRNHFFLDHIFINLNENVTNSINSGFILTEITDRYKIRVSKFINSGNNRKLFYGIDNNSTVSILANRKWT